jgi:NitT/TauT family transport system substrate-binding protein
MKRIGTFSALLILASALLAGCGSESVAQPPDEVTVQLSWTHSAQYAGFYAADQRGYYAEEGLAAIFLPASGAGADTITPVADGTADFGVNFGAGLISARSQGLPVTAIAAIYRRYPLVFITLADSGLRRPQDFPGHTIRTLVPGGSAVAFEAMMTRLGLDPQSVEQVEVGFDLDSFFGGEPDIWPGYITNEVLTAREEGYAVNQILPEDYGVHLYGDVLFTSDQMIEEAPDLVERFLRATLRGWRWAIENPEEAGPLALAYDPTLDVEHLVAQMETSVPLIHTGEGQIGWMQDEVWEGMQEMLLEQAILDAPIDPGSVYSMEFLERIYAGQP